TAPCRSPTLRQRRRLRPEDRREIGCKPLRRVRCQRRCGDTDTRSALQAEAFAGGNRPSTSEEPVDRERFVRDGNPDIETGRGGYRNACGQERAEQRPAAVRVCLRHTSEVTAARR